MTFDARAIKLLSPGMHLTSVSYPGLRLEASASRRSWIYRYRSPVDQALRQVKLGEWPAISVSAAVAEWGRLRALRDEGGDPVMDAKVDKAKKRQEEELVRQAAHAATYTVRDLVDHYLKGHIDRHRAEKGAAEVRRMFKTMLGDVASVPAAELSRAEAFDLISLYAESAPVQAAKLRAELGSAWDYAQDSGRLSENAPNWWRKILRGKIKSKGKQVSGKKSGVQKRVLTPAEVGELIRWLPNFGRRVDDVLTLYLWTGARGAEIVGMRGEEVRFEADGELWWTCPKAKTKNARHVDATDFRVPLFGRARAVVMRLKAEHDDGWLFPAKGRDGVFRQAQQKTIQEAVYSRQPYCECSPERPRTRLPVTHWAPHDLRRTVRTLLASMGCPREIGEVVLGHMITGVAGIYDRHGYDEERKVWLSKLSDQLEVLAATYPQQVVGM